LSAYFFTILIIQKDIPLYAKIFILIILYPTILITITGNSIAGFNMDTCEAINNNFLTIYKLVIELSIISYIVYMTRYAYKKLFSKEKIKQIIIISSALTSFLLIFSITEFISSITGIYEINLYGLLISPLFLLIIVYTITDLKVIKINTVGTQIIAYIIASLILSQILLNNGSPKDILLVVSTFLISASFMILLIYTSRKEERDLYRSFDLEKKALRELEKLTETKDKFIMIAQHNLRIPITAIQNRIASTITQDALGANRSIEKDLNDIQVSIKHLTDIAEDFKNIAQLKVGSNILHLSFIDLDKIIKDILIELKINIENMKLIIEFPSSGKRLPMIRADENKIREVFLVIIENAIKYNVVNGNIIIKTEVSNSNYIITIRNTGIGITNEENSNLSNRSFYRSNRVKNLNPTGMGIGLSLSKTIIEAHHGTLNIYSEGEDSGAMVKIVLPVDFTQEINKKV
jgi:signal transduction histidine kinase